MRGISLPSLSCLRLRTKNTVSSLSSSRHKYTKEVHSRKGNHRADAVSISLSLEEEAASLLSISLTLLRGRLLLFLPFILVLILVRRGALGTTAGGDARALSCSFRGWLLLFLGSFGLGLRFLGASRFLATVGLWLLLLLLLLLGLLIAVLCYFCLFLRIGFGGGSAFAWLVLGSWLILVTAAALFILFGYFTGL